MRIFGGDRMKSIMTTLNVPDDMPIENKLISRSIESAQKKVEGNNFDIRKHLVEYDDVINKHREAIYRLRRSVLEMSGNDENGNVNKLDEGSQNSKFQIPNSKQVQNSNKQNLGQSLTELILEYIEGEIEYVVGFHTADDDVKTWNLEEIYQTISTVFPVDEDLRKNILKYQEEDTPKLEKAKARTEIIEYLKNIAKEKYEKLKKDGEELGIAWPEIEKAVLIRSIDTLWIEHLEAMSSVRQGIGLRGYGQRDPLIEYKKEAYHLFNELNSLIQKEVVYSIFKVGAANQAAAGINAPSLMDRARNFSAPAKTADASNASFAGFKTPLRQGSGEQGNNTSSTFEPKQKLKNEAGEKVGRNDPCPCGSGKKYKKCCGK